MTLPPKLEAIVKEKVESGLYSSSAEVMEEALHLLNERDRLREMRLQELRKEIAKGLEQLDRGEGIPGEQVFEELREKSRRLRETGG